VQTPEIPNFTGLRYLPRDAYYCGGELLPVFDERERVNRKLAGRVCADQIVPYPPGISVLVPGQAITSKIADYLGNLLRSTRRMEMHGVVPEGYLPCIRVRTPAAEKALPRLGSTRTRHHWLLHAFCLMGNHYHLLLETPLPNLSRGMHRLNGAYSQCFNRRHQRVGHVLQGRFTAILVERESYLLELARYVPLN